MDNGTRLQYLEAMGIDVWLPKASVLPKTMVLADAQVDVPPDMERPHEIAVKKSAPIDDTERWQQLQQAVAGCRACALCESRTHTVFGTGNKNADWMLIGEAPGFNEDQEGKPFVGKAGLLLTEMLRAMGLKREEVFIANILKCRPPDNRDPKPEEVEACAEFLQQQIDLVRPKIILAVGRIAAQNLLKTDRPLGKLRGQMHYLNQIPVVVIYHPAYLLRSLLEKRKAWEDLKMAVKVFRDRHK